MSFAAQQRRMWLQVLLAHLSLWDVTEYNIILEPLLVPHAEYYSGMTAQLRILQTDAGITSLVAVGALD